MMKMYETPVQFMVNKKIGDIEISYSELMEIAQGAPEIGILSINGKPVSSCRFGGPLLTDQSFVYAPVYIKNFFGSGFKIARIDINTLEVKLYGNKRNLIFLDRIENNVVHFYGDLFKTKSLYYKIE